MTTAGSTRMPAALPSSAAPSRSMLRPRLLRRWWLLPAAVLAAVTAAWPVAAASPPETAPTSYTANAIILQGSAGTTTLDTIAALATVGEVPEQVARQLGVGTLEGFVSDVRVSVGAQASTPGRAADASPGSSGGGGTRTATTPMLTVQVTTRDPDRSLEAVEVYADAIVAWVASQRSVALEEAAAELATRLETLRAELVELEQTLEEQAAEAAEAAPDEPAAEDEERGGRANGASGASGSTGSTGESLERAEYEAKLDQYTQLLASRGTAASPSVAWPELTRFADARLVPGQGSTASSSSLLPTSRLLRLGIAGLLGAFGGLALLLLVARTDDRIYHWQEAEAAFGMPVRAKIPRLRRKRRVTAEHPGRVDQSFRVLCAGLLHDMAQSGAAGRGRVVLVTSPTMGDGKTTLVENVAAGLSELGRRVIVLSCSGVDSAEPFDAQGQPRAGLAYAVAASNGASLADAGFTVGQTLIQVIPRGEPAGDFTATLGSDGMQFLLENARASADVVLLDGAPLIETSEAAVLLAHADHVIVIARAGRTTSRLAAEAGGLIRSLNHQPIFLVVNRARRPLLRRRARRYFRALRLKRRRRVAPSPTALLRPDRRTRSDNGAHGDRESGHDRDDAARAR
jgi:Mrp family chromosome partitioning ATPase